MATIYRKAPEGRGHSRPVDEWRTTYHSMALTNLVVCSTFVLYQARSKPIEIARIPAAITWSSAPSIDGKCWYLP